ncbi:Epididymal-specific lipocalin-9 [Galemys pyrenaicus]|uniref:Epididymal-specific lipocalin-9 n=1 Tax=Galemys pyrenaicus TaxID=202257 RepID=A0A8J6DSW8_GALPY|nr:Epididymal-specific lipocalin-9 [Galemys pyrenaicus]
MALPPPPLLLLLLPPLLLLSAGLGPACAQEFRLRNVVRGDYDMGKVAGVWHSVCMAADDMRRIGRDGDLRLYIRDIQNLDSGALKFRFFFSCALCGRAGGRAGGEALVVRPARPRLAARRVREDCEAVDVVCEKTDKNGEYTLTYEGENRVLVAETDYDLYITFYLRSVRNGTRVLALYGRLPELSAGFLSRFRAVCRRYGLGPRNIVTFGHEGGCQSSPAAPGGDPGRGPRAGCGAAEAARLTATLSPDVCARK